MCTAISYKTNDHYFGRNLDLEYSYHEAVVITPRNYNFVFREVGEFAHHYAMIGVATIADDYPLYYDATNEFGLSVAGLNFPGNAVYTPSNNHLQRITPFEFIPWILTQCRTVGEAETLIKSMQFSDISFNNDYKLTPLHWIIADSNQSITVEPMQNGIQVFQNSIGVLTNNPPFPYHMANITNYLNLTRNEPENRFAPMLDLSPYSRGMGAIGLPGDLSSASRFIRAAYTLHNSVCNSTDSESISQFFHILGSVAQTSGCAKVGNGFEKTIYTSCCNTTKGVYYYTTYENAQISAVDMNLEDLTGTKLISYPLIRTQQLFRQN